MLKSRSIIWIIFIGILSSYVLYMHTTDDHAVSLDKQMTRQQRWMDGDSEFFNPWQYRILSPLLLQGTIAIYESVSEGNTPYIPYLALHFLQLFILFSCLLVYLKLLNIRNNFLLYVGLILVCYHTATSTYKSGFSFDTYFDVIFYLLAGILILKKRLVWIIPLTFIACLNRETSALIPCMLFSPFTGIEPVMDRRKWIILGLSGLAFVTAFALPRLYFGYEPAIGINGMTRPLEYLTFNITFFRLYPLLVGTMSIIPLVVLIHVKKLKHPYLKYWLILIVPIWLVIHFLKSNAMETRLFLVPQILVFVPAFLYLIEGWYNKTPQRIRDRASTYHVN